MVLTKDIWLPTDAELTVEEVPLGTPSLRAGAMHLGKACEVQNNEFMLCRSETQDPRLVTTTEMAADIIAPMFSPRKCIQEGKDVTSCSMEFFRKVKSMCAAEFMTYATCLERGSSNMEFSECRKTQAAFDNCMVESFGLERPHYGYHCLPKVVPVSTPDLALFLNIHLRSTSLTGPRLWRRSPSG